MNQQSNSFRSVLALLLAAAAIHGAPLPAQESQTAPPVVDVPPVADSPEGETDPADVPEAAAPIPTIKPPPVEGRDEPRSAVGNAGEASPSPAATTGPRDLSSRSVDDAAGSADRATVPADESGQSAGVTDGEAPAEAESEQPERRQERAIWPWLLAGLLPLGAFAGYLFGRRRQGRFDKRSSARLATIPPTSAPSTTATASVATPAAAALGEPGRPWIDLKVVPVRAGVEDGKVRAEFHLTVDNQGTVPARDVRISTWMCLAGPDQSKRDAAADRPPGVMLPEIEAGDAKRIAAAVALPRETIEGSSALPVVVAEACYPLPDGGEARTTASFAVGVPWEGELAHFDLEDPSGLHDGVEARAFGKPEKV
jgi:Meckel syndrome type 1 protein